MDKRANNGGKREGAGRKPKSVEQGIAEKLSPLEPKALKAIEGGLDEGKPWAVRLYMEYVYGKAIETKELKVTKDLPIFGDDID